MKTLLLVFSFSFALCFGQKGFENNLPGKVYPISVAALENTVQLKRNAPASIRNVSVTLPDYSGIKVTYALQENDLSTERAAEVTTFNGVSADGKAQLKLSLFKDHFIALIKNTEGYFYVEPYKTAPGSYRVYPAFSDFGTNFTCNNGADADLMKELSAIKENLSAKASAPNFPYGNQMRRFRMAIATTGEFTQAFAGDQDLALAEALSMLNLINLIYESEVSISFTVISKTTDKTLIFTNPATDPFTVSPTFASAANSQTGFVTMNANGTLPYALYDIGHTFNIITSGGAQGQAGNQPCSNTSKARAWSQWDVDLPKSITANLIVHEMGHQFTAGHTFNAVGGSSGSPTFCTDGWNANAAVEPGAGTTIMSYGNNCTIPANQTNTGNNGLNYFNAKSLDQIIANLTGPGSCFAAQATANLLPSANAGADITIPANTPFTLRGIGSDPNDANLSYTWEQGDNATANDRGAFGNAVAGSGGYTANNSTARAPLFRSAQSTSTTERIFPRMQFILNNQNVPPLNEAEVLPAVARTMKFRFTVRDNNALSGGVDSDEMVVTVAANGPLQVTAPSLAGLTLPALSPTNITWNVNGTNAQKSTVNILLSTDGGNSFPYTLATNTPNDGSENLTIPNVPNTALARIKVVAVLNPLAEFFDISDNNFTITSTCDAYNSYITPALRVETPAGSTESNLNMVAPGAAGAPFTAKLIDYTLSTTNNVFTYADATLTTPKLAVNNYPAVTYSFKVTKTGSYVFTKTGAFLIVTIHSGAPYSLANFVGSNAYNTTGNSYSSANATQSMTLQEGVTYYAVVCNFSNPANTLSYTITSSGAGSLYNNVTPAAGYSYTFLAIGNADGKIKAVSATADFSALPTGTYTVQGISYPNALSTATFVNKTISELSATGACFALSGNSRDLQLNAALGTGEITTSNDGIILAPNPVGNYLTVKSTKKITEYQIYDLAGRMIIKKVFSGDTINVSSLQTGTYVVTLLNGSKVLHQEKIIKK